MLLTAVSEAWGQHGRGSRARQQSIGIRAFPFVRAAWRLPQALGAAQVLGGVSAATAGAAPGAAAARADQPPAGGAQAGTAFLGQE
ncbi:hypothetical protein UE98_32045 [Burkholderia cenocepacia]|nr:hypothetical protein UE98_32045 [Burkholderia cenocepacia]